jgi:hypothetical protein
MAASPSADTVPRMSTPRFQALRLAIGFAILLMLGACAGRREPVQPVAWNEQAVRGDASRVGVAIRELPDREANYPGARCLACRPLASANNRALTLHAATLDGRAELEELRTETVALLKKRGIDAVEIAEALAADDEVVSAQGEVTSLPAQVDALRQRHRLGRLLVFEFESLGFARPYMHYVPASLPYAVVEGRAYMIELGSRRVSWMHRMRALPTADGEWDEPPDYPGLTNAYFQAIESVKDRVKQILER